MKHFWFGDSWTAGDELTDTTLSFPSLISNHFNSNCINLAVCGGSNDRMYFEFLNVLDKINPVTDTVFFALTEKSRICFFDETGKLKNLLVNGGYTNHNIHPYYEKWYKFFDSDVQQNSNVYKILSLLHLICKTKKIKHFFFNAFSTLDSINLDLINDDYFLVPKNECVAQFLLKYKGDNNYAEMLYHNEKFTIEQWQEQKLLVDKYFSPNWAHPNIDGHKTIAEELIKRINFKN